MNGRGTRGHFGFSLVELVACLLLMAVVGGVWGLGMIQAIDGFLTSRRNAEVFMKGQMAITRIVKELRMASEIGTDPVPTADLLEFVRTDDGRDRRIRIEHDTAAGTVEINDETLVDGVRQFFLRYAETYADDSALRPEASVPAVPRIRLVAVFLDLNGPQDTVVRFRTRVFLRGLR